MNCPGFMITGNRVDFEGTIDWVPFTATNIIVTDVQVFNDMTNKWQDVQNVHVFHKGSLWARVRLDDRVRYSARVDEWLVMTNEQLFIDARNPSIVNTIG